MACVCQVGERQKAAQDAMEERVWCLRHLEACTQHGVSVCQRAMEQTRVGQLMVAKHEATAMIAGTMGPRALIENDCSEKDRKSVV